MAEDKIANVFGLTPIEEFDTITPDGEVIQLNDVPVDPSVDQALEDAQNDFTDIRDRIKDMLDKSSAVFDSAHLVATTSQNPKDIEAFARILDSITKTGKELMTMHKDVYSLKPPVVEAPQAQQAETINNIIFQGSGVDFIEFVKSKTKQPAITDQSKEE